MRALFFPASLLIAYSTAAMAQPVPADGRTVLSPLPPASLAETARPSDYLRAAQGALAAGRMGEAQEALEMAQTRMLDRDVPLGQTNNPSANPTVEQITRARQALAARDRDACLRFIQAAIASATTTGL